MKYFKTAFVCFVSLFIGGIVFSANPIRYVQISTNSLSQQSGSFNVNAGTMSSVYVTGTSTLTTVNVSGVVTASASVTLSSTTTLSGPTTVSSTFTATSLSTVNVSGIFQLNGAAGSSKMGVYSQGTSSVPIWSYAGRILQVSSFTATTGSSTTATSFQSTLLSGTITPSTTTSIILVMAQGNLSHNASGFSGMAVLANGTTSLSPDANGTCEVTATATGFTGDTAPCTMWAVDTPNSVSVQTYRVRIKTMSGTGETDWSRQNTAGSSLLLVEIGRSASNGF